MKGWFSRKGGGVRITACVVTVAFLYAEAVQAQGISRFVPTSTIPSQEKAFAQNPLENLELAPEIGQLQDFYLSSENKIDSQKPFILHIQDSHANFEAQQNIAKILEQILAHNGNSAPKIVICLEGAKGKIDPSFFRQLKEDRAKKQVAGYFLKEGKITAAEYVAMLAQEPLSLWGVEESELYQENLERYQEVRALASQAIPVVEKKLGELQAEAQQKMPQAYLELEEQTRKLYDNQSDIADYLSYLELEMGVDLATTPQLNEMRQAVQLQKSLNLKTLEKERALLMEKLPNKLLKEEMADLIKITLEFRVGKQGSLDYHRTLLDYAREAGLKGSCRELKKFVNLLEIQKEINTQQVMRELENLTDSLREKLLQTEAQRELARKMRGTELALKMIRLEVTREQLEDYRRGLGEIAALFQSRAETLKALEAAQKFYEVAEARDRALIENTLKALENGKKQIAILITGGFHTRGLVARLKDLETSHAVIAPRLTQAGDDKLYASLMEEELSPLQRFLSSTGNRLATPSYLFVEQFLGRHPELRRQQQGSDRRLLLLMHLGEKVFGKSGRELAAAVEEEPVSPYLRNVSASVLPQGVLISAVNEEGGQVGVLVSREKSLLRHALEVIQTDDGLYFVFGNPEELKREAAIPRTLYQARAVAREPMAASAAKEAKKKGADYAFLMKQIEARETEAAAHLKEGTVAGHGLAFSKTFSALQLVLLARRNLRDKAGIAGEEKEKVRLAEEQARLTRLLLEILREEPTVLLSTDEEAVQFGVELVWERYRYWVTDVESLIAEGDPEEAARAVKRAQETLGWIRDHVPSEIREERVEKEEAELKRLVDVVSAKSAPKPEKNLIVKKAKPNQTVSRLAKRLTAAAEIFIALFTLAFVLFTFPILYVAQIENKTWAHYWGVVKSTARKLAIVASFFMILMMNPTEAQDPGRDRGDAPRPPAVERPEERAPPLVPPLPGETVEQRRAREAAILAEILADRTQKAEQMRQALASWERAAAYTRDELAVEQARYGALARWNGSLGRLNSELFAVGIDMSETEMTLGRPHPTTGRQERVSVPTERFGNIVEMIADGRRVPMGFASYDEFQRWFFQNRAQIWILDSQRRRVTNLLTINEMIRNRQAIEIWFGDPANKDNIVDGRAQAFKLEFGMKALLETAGVARSQLGEITRRIELHDESSRPGGPIAHLVYMRDASRRYQRAPELVVPDIGRVPSTIQTLRDLAILPAENFRFYEWPREEELQEPGRVVQGRRITDRYDLFLKDQKGESYQVWYFDPASGEEYFVLFGTNAIQARLQDSEQYLAQRQLEFRVRAALSQNVDPSTISDFVAGRLDALGSGRAFYEFAELEVNSRTGMSTGLHRLHEFGDLEIETGEVRKIGRRGTEIYDVKPDAHGYPVLRLTQRDQQGRPIGQRARVGFFVPAGGGRWMRLQAGEVNGFNGRYEMRVITDAATLERGERFFTEGQLGNKLIFGRNVLRQQLTSNTLAMFGTLVELMDAEHALDAIDGEIVISTITAVFNIATFAATPSVNTGQWLRHIPGGVRVLYQLIVQSSTLPPTLPRIDLSIQEGETEEQAEARIRRETAEVLDSIRRDAGSGNFFTNRIRATTGAGLQTEDAQQLLGFIDAAAASIFRRGNIPDVTQLNPQELEKWEQERLFVVVRIFDLDWLRSLPHDEREVTSKIDFFTSLLVNVAGLTDWNRGEPELVRLRPDGSGGFNGEFRQDPGNSYQRFVQRFFSGDIGGRGVIPAPTTVGFVPATSFLRVLREVPGAKGTLASLPLPLSIGPSLSSLIKTISFGNFYQESPYVWEPEAIVVQLFGFPLQIFGARSATSTYIEGLQNYAVVVDIPDRHNWFERFADTFTGGNVRAVTSEEEYRRFRSGQIQLLGFARIPMPKNDPADPIERERYQEVPIYGVMSPDGINQVVIFGMKSFQDHQEEIQSDLDNYDQYQQLMGENGGVIVEVSAGSSYQFTAERIPAGEAVNLREFLRFYRNHRNPPTHFIQSHFAPAGTPEHLEAPLRNQGETFDQALTALAQFATGDSESALAITQSLLERNELLATARDNRDGTSLFVNSINIAEGTRGNDSGVVHPGPNAFVGLALIQRIIDRNPEAYRSYRVRYLDHAGNQNDMRSELNDGSVDGYDGERVPSGFYSQIDDEMTAEAETLERVKLIAQGLIERMDTDDSRSLTYGGIWQDKERGIMSVEENLAAYAMLMRLFELTDTEEYQDKAEMILHFISRMQAPSGDYFYVGTHKEGNRIVPTPTYATDVQVLSLQAIGYEVLEDARQGDHFLFGPQEGVAGRRHVAAHILNRLRNPETGSRVVFAGVEGFDSTNQAGREEIRRLEGSDAARPPAIFVEQSAYVALAERLLAGYYRNFHRNEELAGQWDREADRHLAELAKLMVRSNGGGVGLPYATHTGILRYAFDSWRVPEAAVSASSNAAFLLAHHGANPYWLNGESWYYLRPTPLTGDLFAGFPEIGSATPTDPDRVVIAVDGTNSVEIDLRHDRRSVSLANTDQRRPGEYYKNLLQALTKVRSWESLPAAEQSRLAGDPARKPTDAERALVQGKTLLWYDQSTNTFAYTDSTSNRVHRVVMIPSYRDIDQTRQKLQRELERSRLEERVLRDGTLRFLDPQSNLPINEAGRPMTEGGTPKFIFGSADMREFNQFLIDHLSMLPIVEQQTALSRGMFRTTVTFTRNGQQVQQEVLVIIHYGIHSAEENLRQNEATDTRIRTINDLIRMRSESGVIITDANGSLLELIVGEERALQIVRWVASLRDSAQRKAIVEANYADIDMGDGKRYTVTFGTGLADTRLQELQERVALYDTFRQRIEIAIANLQRGPPYWHPEWMFVPGVEVEDPATGGVIIPMTHIFTGHTHFETHWDGQVIHRFYPETRRETVNDRYLGDKKPYYTRGTGEAIPGSVTLIFPVGVNPNGSNQYGSIDNITETYHFTEDRSTGIQFLTTHHWLDGTVERTWLDRDHNVNAITRGTFDRASVRRDQPFDPAAVDVHFTSREEMDLAPFSIEYQTSSDPQTFTGQVSVGSIVSTNINSATGERAAGTADQIKMRGRSIPLAELSLEDQRLLQRGHQIVELTNEWTEGKKIQVINPLGRVIEERSRAQIVYFEYDPSTRINRPTRVVDRFTGLALITFTTTTRDAATGNLISVGTNLADTPIIDTRTAEGDLVSLQIGDEKTTYELRDFQEVPIQTVDIATGAILIQYKFEFDPATKQTRVTAYDLRTREAQTQIWNGPLARLEQVLTGSYQSPLGDVRYDSRTEVAYVGERETSRTTFVDVDSTGKGGREFERSLVSSIASNGQKTLEVTRLMNDKTFTRIIDAAGHLLQEEDTHTRVVYRYRSEWGVSIPLYKQCVIRGSGVRGNSVTINGNSLDHVLSTFEVKREGENFSITETRTQPAGSRQSSQASIEIRSSNMRLLQKLYPNNNVLHFDGSLLERPLCHTARSGVTREISGRTFQNVVSTFEVQPQRGGITQVTEVEQRDSRMRGLPTVVSQWNQEGQLVRQEKIFYAVLPDALGRYPRSETRTTENTYSNPENPNEITRSVTRTNHPEFLSLHPDGIIVETERVEHNGFQSTHRAKNHLTGLERILTYDDNSGFDSPIREQYGQFSVENKLGDRVFRLRNMGQSQFTGERWWTQLAEPAIDTVWPSDDFAWVRINLGLTYSTVLPKKPPFHITHFDVSRYDTLTFYIRGNQGKEKYAITFTDSSGSINRSIYTWFPTRAEEQIETGWKKVTIPLSEIRAHGVNLNELVQIGVQYGNEIEDEPGNPTGAEIYLSNSMFESSNPNVPSLPVLSISGENTGAGAFEHVDHSLTGGYAVLNSFAEETLPPAISRREGRFSYLRDERGSIVGTTDFILEDNFGRRHFRVWRLQEGNHVNYVEVQNDAGQVLFHVYEHREIIDNYQYSWKERLYLDSLGIPLFSVYEHDNPQQNWRAGELSRLYQATRDTEGNLTVWELNVQTQVEKVTLYHSDGTVEELKREFYSPPQPSWDRYQQSVQSQLNELATHWNEKYKITDEYVVPRIESTLKEWIAGLTALLVALIGVIAALLGRRTAPTLTAPAPVSASPPVLPPGKATAKILSNAEKVPLIEEMKSWVRSLGWTEQEMEDLNYFFEQEALLRWEQTGEERGGIRYVKIPSLEGKKEIPLKRYVLKMAIMRYLGHFGSSQMPEFLADKAMALPPAGDPTFKEKVMAYRDLAYKMVRTQDRLRKVADEYKASQRLERRKILMFEDVSALCRYLREGKIQEKDLDLDLDSIVKKNKDLKIDEKDINSLVNNDIKNYAKKVQEALAQVDKEEGLIPRNETQYGPFSRLFRQFTSSRKLLRFARFLETRMPPIQWIAHALKFKESLENTLLSDRWLPHPNRWRFLSIVLGIGAISLFYFYLSTPLTWSFLIGYLIAKGIFLSYRLFYSAQKKGPSSSWGILFWTVAVGAWLGWNIFIAQVWFAGVVPYWEWFQEGSTPSALLLLAASAIPAFFNLILSFFAVTWAIGSFTTTFFIMEGKAQARIKATQKPHWGEVLSVIAVVAGLAILPVVMGALSVNSGIVIGGVASAIGIVLFLLNKCRGNGTLKDLPQMLYEKYKNNQAKLNRIQWEYNSLIQDMFDSYKLTREERDQLLLPEGKNFMSLNGSYIAAIQNKEAQDRLKFWANSLLRKDPLPEAPAWKDLPSLTLLIPSVDAFRHDWNDLNFIDNSSGETRFYKLLYGGYRQEFVNFLKRAREEGIPEGWATEEQIQVMENYMQRGSKVNLPPFEGPIGKKFMRKVEDWANDRLQMLETTYKGFLRVKQAYREEAQKEMARIKGKEIKNLEAKEKEEAEKLLNQKFQILWSVGGINMATFVKKPISRGNNSTDKKSWDLIKDLWDTLNQALIEVGRPELISTAKKSWKNSGIMDNNGFAGPEFSKEIQAESIERKLRDGWDEILRQLTPAQVEKLRDEIIICQLGHVLVHGINFAFVKGGKTFELTDRGAGSPKAKAMAVAMPFVRGETVMFFDGDTEIRLEDARKLPQVQQQFVASPKLGGLQFRQYIFNEPYNRQTEVASEAVNSFWGAMLRLKSKVGSVGFYGHNGIFRMQFLMDFDSIQPSHISEDLLGGLSMRAYGAEMNYEDRLQFGEGEETTVAMYAGPTGKWAQGATLNELQGSRIFELYLANPDVPFAEKFDTLFNLAFYTVVHYFTIPGIIAFVLGAFVLGANPFAVLSVAYIFIGWGMSQAIGGFSLSQYIERNGYFKGALKWLSFLFLRGGFYYWTVLIASQSEGLKKGLKEKGAWHTAVKDQGTLSESWEKLYGIFTLGLNVSLLLFLLLPFAPITPWLFLVPLAMIGVVALWALKLKDKVKLEWVMLFVWLAPIVGGLFTFPIGGGVVITSIFYLYVIKSFLISPFVFNPNPLRLNLELYDALAKLENNAVPYRKIGTALSRKIKKLDRIRELLNNEELKNLFQDYRKADSSTRNFDAVSAWLDGQLTPEEKAGVTLKDVAEYLFKTDEALIQYQKNEIEESLKAHSLKDIEKSPELESFKFLGLSIGKRVNQILAFAVRLVTKVDEKFLKGRPQARVLWHWMTFLFLRVFKGYFIWIKDYIAYFKEEVLRDQEAEYAAWIAKPVPPPAPPAAPAVSTTTPTPPPPTLPSSPGAPSVTPASVPAASPAPAANASVTPPQSFARREGVKLSSQEIHEGIDESFGRSQLVIPADGQLNLRGSRLAKAAAWEEILRKAMVALTQTLKDNPDLGQYWTQLLSNEDNRAPPIFIQVSQGLDDKDYDKINSIRNVVRQPDGRVSQVEIIFSEKFVRSLIPSASSYSDVVAWLVAERLFHELGHTNSSKTPSQALTEEIALIGQDLALFSVTQSQLATAPRQTEIKRFFEENKANIEFRSGFFFDKFLGSLLPLNEKERAQKIFKFASEAILAEQNLPSQEESRTPEAPGGKSPAEKASPTQSILRKLLERAQGEPAKLQLLLKGLPLPVEATETPVTVFQALIDREDAVPADLLKFLVRAAAENPEDLDSLIAQVRLTPEEEKTLRDVRGAEAQRRAAIAAGQADLLQVVRSLFIANAGKEVPELVVFDSSLFKRFKEDAELLNLLRSYRNQVAILVMTGDESNRDFIEWAKEVTVVYENQKPSGISLEHSALFGVNLEQHKQGGSLFDTATILTVEQNSDKWQWYRTFHYYVAVSKGDQAWSEWFARPAIQAVLLPLLEQVSVDIEEVLRTRDPKAAEQELRLRDHVVLINA